MWHVLKAELIYFRPWLLGALGIGGGVVILVTLINQAVGDIPGHVATGIRGVFLVMAPMIAGFVAQNYRHEERRSRLLMAGPLTPLRIGGVMVLLPVCLTGIGAAVSGSVMVAGALIAKTFEPEAGSVLGLQALNMVGYVGGMVFAMLLVGLLIQEAVAARRQRRVGAAAAGWATFVVGVLFFAAVNVAAFRYQGPLTWISLHACNLVVAVAAMAASVALYARRTDFTQ